MEYSVIFLRAKLMNDPANNFHWINFCQCSSGHYTCLLNFIQILPMQSGGEIGKKISKFPAVQYNE